MTEPCHYDHVHVWLPIHVTWLHFTYSLDCFPTIPRPTCQDLRVRNGSV